ncbi:MAG TPA: hypothetical protein VG735_07870 [Caulobacterales bacterium]|nr:hypothetical protein [Caulobacterales bacterium]
MTEQTTQNIDAGAAAAPSGQPWAYGIRTCGPGGKAYNGYEWPLTVGEIARAPDWKPTAACGNGLHINPFGMGDWLLLSNASDAVWLLVKYDPGEAVALDGKVKVPWAIVEQVGSRSTIGGMMAALAAHRTAHIKTLLQKPAEPSTTGNDAHSSTTGDGAHSSTTGNRAHSSTTGDDAHSSTTGDGARSSTTGDGAHSSTTGYGAHSSTTGYGAHSSTTGYGAHSSTTGYGAHSSTTGNRAHSSTTGYGAHSSTTGYGAHSSTTGYGAHSSTTGDDAHSSTKGTSGIASALGIDGRAKAGVNGAIFLSEWKQNASNHRWELVGVFASMVGQHGIEPDTFYTLRDGVPVKAEEAA